MAITDLQQATLVDIQEKVTETHELLKREEEFGRRHQILMERRFENAVKIGQNLCDFKATLPHGKFITFVQAEFGMSRFQASDYMLLAERGNVVNSQHLSLNAHIELASPSTPPEVIEMVDTGQIPATIPAIREAKREIQREEMPQRNALAALQSSESNEWYTPTEYIETARKLMGGIDIDPASCAEANRIVNAKDFYTKKDNGLNQPWRGRVWLNPPYGFDSGISNQELWSRTLINRYEITRSVTEAVLLVNANTEAKWFQPLYSYLICFTNHRIRFYNVAGESNQPTQGNALIYFGKKQQKFIELFSRFGTIVKKVSQ